MPMIRYGFVSPSLIFMMLFTLIPSLGWSDIGHRETPPSADGRSWTLGAKAKRAELSSASSRLRIGVTPMILSSKMRLPLQCQPQN